MIRTTVLIMIPLLAIAVAAHATPIYEFGSPVATMCGGGAGNCTPAGGVSGTTTPSSGSTPGAAYLNITTPEQYLEASNSTNGSFEIHWSGTGDGTLLPTIPVAWDF